MSGINYLKYMEELFNNWEDKIKADNGNNEIVFCVRKKDFMNKYIYDMGLTTKTGKQKFTDAETIGMIRYHGRDPEGYELIHVKGLE